MQSGKPSMSDEAVQRATGKGWDDWFALLDKDEAQKLSHPEIARLLAEKHGVDAWWAQSVTVEYERARGLRAKYQTAEGFSVSVSKTVPVPLSTLYAAWSDPAVRERWLETTSFEVTTATENKSVRIAWGDGSSRVDAGFYSKGESKSQVAVQHSKLSGTEQVEEFRKFWRAALSRMAELLESS